MSITEKVLLSVSNASDERTRTISQALVRHLHDFIREVRPSTAEWERGVEFLTAVGKVCDDQRQEFILLSDVLGVSMLVDELNSSTEPTATESTVLGPFYRENAPDLEEGASIDGVGAGTPLHMIGTVVDTNGRPCSGVTVEVWQADGEGAYDVQRDPSTTDLRGRFKSGNDGTFSFWSVVPSSYAIPQDGPVGAMLRSQGRHPFRPAHIHFRFEGADLLPLQTHIFLAGDRYLDSDAVFGVKPSLIESFVDEDFMKDGADVQSFRTLQRTFILEVLDSNRPGRNSKNKDGASTGL